MFKPGNKLDNGGVVLACAKTEGLGENAGVVLAHVDGYEPYVTWAIDLSNGNCYAGHYFRDILSAVEDFAERADIQTVRSE